MDYRLATHEDWVAVGNYVNSLNYFLPVDPARLGGNWLIAVDQLGAIHGTIWFFGSTPNAYVDYWSATNGVIAAKLAGFLQSICELTGIKYVRGMIAAENASALRLATQGFGLLDSGGNYKLVFRSF